MALGPQEPVRRVTLADVASRAGVSTALASIVMRNAPGASAQSRERIRRVAAELGYRPDARARSLASLSTRVMGVLFGRAGRFHLELLDGLYTAAAERGCDLVLSALTASRDEHQALESLHESRFDALVMLGPPVAVPELAGQLPVVVMGWHVDHPDVDIVRTSDEHGMSQAVDHLVELGHRDIVHLQGGDGLVALARRSGYEAAMRAAGLSAHVRVVECHGEDQLDGQRAAAAMLADGRLPTAIIAFNDDLGAAAMSVLAQQGIDVPRDISVIGFDDSELARSPFIELTSIQQLPQEMARLAVARVIARTDGSDVVDREIVLEPSLIVRHTTAPAATT